MSVIGYLRFMSPILNIILTFMQILHTKLLYLQGREILVSDEASSRSAEEKKKIKKMLF